MNTPEITVKRREGTGKGIARRLRREGAVPAILYGGSAPQTITVNPRDVLRIISGHAGTTQLLSLKLDGDGGARFLLGLRVGVVEERFGFRGDATLVPFLPDIDDVFWRFGADGRLRAGPVALLESAWRCIRWVKRSACGTPRASSTSSCTRSRCRACR